MGGKERKAGVDKETREVRADGTGYAVKNGENGRKVVGGGV